MIGLAPRGFFPESVAGVVHPWKKERPVSNLWNKFFQTLESGAV